MDINIRAALAGMAEGDMEAFGELYNLLATRVFNYARAITGSRETAEDVTHDVFLRLLGQAGKLAKMDNPVAYIMVATRNHSYDKGKHKTVPLEDAPEPCTNSYDRLLLEDAFSRLPASQRETVYLCHVCGFSQKETARITGAPLVTVKWRSGKALNQLRDYFKDEEENCHEVAKQYHP